MAITRTAMVDDDGSGTTGTIINNAWKTELYNQIDAVSSGGTWTDVAFNAANFSTPTAGATWTVTAATYVYTVIGKTVFVSLVIENTGTITGAPVRLRVALPAGLSPTRTSGSTFSYYVAGAGTGQVGFGLAATAMDLLRDTLGTTFAPGGTYIYLQGMYFIA